MQEGEFDFQIHLLLSTKLRGSFRRFNDRLRWRSIFNGRLRRPRFEPVSS